jgi:hypothetical protein
MVGVKDKETTSSGSVGASAVRLPAASAYGSQLPPLSALIRTIVGERREILTTKRIALQVYYFVLLVIAGSLVAFSVIQLSALFRGTDHVLSLPAALVLAAAGSALLFEFCIGLRVDLR